MILVEPYFYYPPDATHPVLCEVRDNFVWFWDSDRAVPMANFPGRFVKLVEQPAPPAPIDYETVVIVYKPVEVEP
jgi:hypothetical protein